MVFGKDDFQRGIGAKVLEAYAEDPLPCLDEETKKKMTAVHSALLQKFTELAFDDASEIRWQERTEPDNLDVPATESECNLFETSENPF
jgi:hypothetical protein